MLIFDFDMFFVDLKTVTLPDVRSGDSFSISSRSTSMLCISAPVKVEFLTDKMFFLLTNHRIFFPAFDAKISQTIYKTEIKRYTF